MSNKKISPQLEEQLIKWVKKNKYFQGDYYYACYVRDNIYYVGYGNDYPLQHGEGKSFNVYVLNNEIIEIPKSSKGR